jgi:hypothetical protein
LNTNPGDAVINFKMQKKISGTPLDAAIYFKKDKLLFTLKAWNRYSELKLDYYKYLLTFYLTDKEFFYQLNSIF